MKGVGGKIKYKKYGDIGFINVIKVRVFYGYCNKLVYYKGLK